MFDLLVIIGQVDVELSSATRDLSKKGDLTEGFDVISAGGINPDLHDKYREKLYDGVLCQLTGGEPKNVIEGIAGVILDFSATPKMDSEMDFGRCGC